MNKVPLKGALKLSAMLVVATLLSAPVSTVLAQSASADVSADVGQRVGDFALLDHKGLFHHMSWYDNRKAIVLLVQANGSESFRQALPKFQALHEAHQEDFKFFMLNPLGQSRASVIDSVASAGEELPVLIDDAQIVASRWVCIQRVRR